MEQIKLTQTQTFSSISSVIGESIDSPASVPAAIDERLISDKVLGVQQRHLKGNGHIVKGKRKVSETS